MTRKPTFYLLLASLLGLDARAGATSNDQEMNATWQLVSAELGGQPWPKQLVDTVKLIIDDDKYTVMVGKGRDEGTVKQDSSQSPKTIDVTGIKGPNVGKTFLAIYELKGDDLRVCYDLSGKSRPTEFATKPGTQLFLANYRRAKP